MNNLPISNLITARTDEILDNYHTIRRTHLRRARPARGRTRAPCLRSHRAQLRSLFPFPCGSGHRPEQRRDCSRLQPGERSPSGTCAERSACYYAHARYPEAKFEAIAIAARGLDGEFTSEPTAPCGACRQALLEYEMLAGHPVELLLAGRDKIYRLPSIVSTLPFAFTELTES